MNNYLESLILLRRALHSQPESGWTEFLTTAFIAEKLQEYGFSIFLGEDIVVREFISGTDNEGIEKGILRAQQKGVSSTLLKQMNGVTGCMGVLETHRPGKTIALRFDIDAVDVSELATSEHFPFREGFHSRNPGCMHACGHDGHTAVGLMLAQWLYENKASLTGSFKLIFQPAEEGTRGAKPMAEKGIVDDVDYLLCAHLSFIASSGELVIDPQQFLSTKKLKVIFNGKSAHAGAQPHLGRNALAAACQATMQLLAIPRHGSGISRINIGALHSGQASNVIPDRAEMKLEVRGETDEINDYMFQQVKNIIAGCSLSYQVEYNISTEGQANSLLNDEELIKLLGKVINDVPEITSPVQHRLFGGSEDATVLIKRVQQKGGKGIYFIVGADRTSGHHQSDFDFDEKMMLTMFKVYCQMIMHLSNQQH